jgi:hypothetical protein
MPRDGNRVTDGLFGRIAQETLRALFKVVMMLSEAAFPPTAIIHRLWIAREFSLVERMPPWHAFALPGYAP